MLQKLAKVSKDFCNILQVCKRLQHLPCSMPFTKEDKILIKKLKGYNDKHLVREFPSKGWNVSSIYKVLQ